MRRVDRDALLLVERQGMEGGVHGEGAVDHLLVDAVIDDVAEAELAAGGVEAAAEPAERLGVLGVGRRVQPAEIDDRQAEVAVDPVGLAAHAHALLGEQRLGRRPDPLGDDLRLGDQLGSRRTG